LRRRGNPIPILITLRLGILAAADPVAERAAGDLPPAVDRA
jgi:hypothetical protein